MAQDKDVKMPPLGMLNSALRIIGKASIEEMAEYMGVSPSRLSSIEMGHEKPTRVEVNLMFLFIRVQIGLKVDQSVYEVALNLGNEK